MKLNAVVGGLACALILPFGVSGDEEAQCTAPAKIKAGLEDRKMGDSSYTLSNLFSRGSKSVLIFCLKFEMSATRDRASAMAYPSASTITA